MPEGWEATTLGEVMQPGRPKVAPQDFPDFPFVGLEHVAPNALAIHGSVRAATMRSQAVRFNKGDVLYGRLRPYLNKVVCPSFEGLCSAEFIVLPPPRGVEPKLVQYLMHSSRFVAFASHQHEGDRPRVDFDQISAFAFALPPPAEQRRIAAAIEEQLSRVDAGAEALQRAKKELGRYRTSVLKAACEGRLVPTEAALARAEGRSYEPARELLAGILAERRSRWDRKKKYTEPVPSSTSLLFDLPEGWVWATVEQLTSSLDYGTSHRASTDTSGIPILRMGNIKPCSIEYVDLKYLPNSHQEFPKLLLEPEDLLFNRTNSPELVGKSAVYSGSPRPCSFASYLVRARFLPGASARFASFFINSAFGRSWIASVVSQQVGQANVSGSKLAALCVPLPPLAEQHRIVAEVERRLSIADEVAATVDSALVRAGRLRQSILKRAFEGRLVPQDPNDEPASVLLERIRAEQAAGENGKPRARRQRVTGSDARPGHRPRRSKAR